MTPDCAVHPPVPLAHFIHRQDVILLLNQFRKALSEGGEAVPLLLGLSEKVLQQQPLDGQALACKGAAILLLACHGMEPNRRATYMQTGLELIDQARAMARSGDLGLVWLTGMTLGALRPEWGRHPQAIAMLKAGIAAPGLMQWQQLCALCMLAGLAQLAGAEETARHHFTAARELGGDEAMHLYCQFMERRSDCEAAP